MSLYVNFLKAIRNRRRGNLERRNMRKSAAAGPPVSYLTKPSSVYVTAHTELTAWEYANRLSNKPDSFLSYFNKIFVFRKKTEARAWSACAICEQEMENINQNRLKETIKISKNCGRFGDIAIDPLAPRKSWCCLRIAIRVMVTHPLSSDRGVIRNKVMGVV